MASERPRLVATGHGRCDVVVWLLGQGADVGIGDLKGKISVVLARAMGEEGLLGVLEGA